MSVRGRLCRHGSGHVRPGESEGPRWYFDMPQWSRDISAAIDFSES